MTIPGDENAHTTCLGQSFLKNYIYIFFNGDLQILLHAPHLGQAFLHGCARTASPGPGLGQSRTMHVCPPKPGGCWSSRGSRSLRMVPHCHPLQEQGTVLNTNLPKEKEQRNFNLLSVSNNPISHQLWLSLPWTGLFLRKWKREVPAPGKFAMLSSGSSWVWEDSRYRGSDEQLQQ